MRNRASLSSSLRSALRCGAIGRLHGRAARLAAGAIIACAGLGVAGCGGDGNDDDDDFGEVAAVVDVGVDDGNIRVGDATISRVGFTFSPDEVFNDRRTVVIVVAVGPGLRYREGTAEIQGDGGDEQIGARVSRCGDGTSFLEFEVDDDDLDFADDPGGDADAELTFTLDAVSLEGLVNVEARASYDSIFYSCDTQFLADATTFVNIAP